MSVRYPYDPFALPERPDIHPPEPVPASFGRTFGSVTRRIALIVAGFFAAAVALAVILFIPVLIREIGRVDAVMLAGELLPVYSIAERLQDLFFGTLILSVAILSFLAASALAYDPRTDPTAAVPVEPDREGKRRQRPAGHHYVSKEEKHV